jgi:PAS domain S-box-containing protein
MTMESNPIQEDPETEGSHADARPNERIAPVDGSFDEKETPYSLRMDTLPVGIREIDTSGVIISANKAHHRMYGYKDGEMIGTSVFDLQISESERKSLAAYLNLIIKEQPLPEPFTARNVTKEGRIVHVQVNWDYKRDMKGHVIGFVSSITDLTAQKRSEEALLRDKSDLESRVTEQTAEIARARRELQLEIEKRRRAQAKLRDQTELLTNVIKSGSNGIFVLDENIHYVLINPASGQITGYYFEDWNGKRAGSHVHPHDRLKAAEAFKQVFSGEEREIELRVKGSDGKYRRLSVKMSPLIWKGKPHVLGLVTDLTGQKAAEAILRESEARLRMVTGQIPAILWTTDAELRVISFYGTDVGQLFGVERENILGMKFSEILKDDTRSAFPDAPQHRALRGESVSFELNWMGRTFDIHLEPLRNPKRGIAGTIGIALDVTRRKEVERMLTQREQDLEIKTHSLEELNAALRALLKRRDEERADYEKNLRFSFQEMIMPYLGKLKQSRLNDRQKALTDILEDNLKDLIAPFPLSLSSMYLELTPSEIRVANLIRQGRSTKEIADLLNVSQRTVESHRVNLREKLGIKHKKANLRTHLLSIG